MPSTVQVVSIVVLLLAKGITYASVTGIVYLVPSSLNPMLLKLSGHFDTEGRYEGRGFLQTLWTCSGSI
jgi:hypothetical protein